MVLVAIDKVGENSRKGSNLDYLQSYTHLCTHTYMHAHTHANAWIDIHMPAFCMLQYTWYAKIYRLFTK